MFPQIRIGSAQQICAAKPETASRKIRLAVNSSASIVKINPILD